MVEGVLAGDPVVPLLLRRWRLYVACPMPQSRSGGRATDGGARCRHGSLHENTPNSLSLVQKSAYYTVHPRSTFPGPHRYVDKNHHIHRVRRLKKRNWKQRRQQETHVVVAVLRSCFEFGFIRCRRTGVSECPL